MGRDQAECICKIGRDRKAVTSLCFSGLWTQSRFITGTHSLLLELSGVLRPIVRSRAPDGIRDRFPIELVHWWKPRSYNICEITSVTSDVKIHYETRRVTVSSNNCSPAPMEAKRPRLSSTSCWTSVSSFTAFCLRSYGHILLPLSAMSS